MWASNRWSMAAWQPPTAQRWEPSQVRPLLLFAGDGAGAWLAASLCCGCQLPLVKLTPSCASSPWHVCHLAATGNPFSVAAGRLSFTYGFSGPAVSIDTACSSAMVGTHMAVQHLQRHRGGALSAGINLMLAERTTSAAQIAGKGENLHCVGSVATVFGTVARAGGGCAGLACLPWAGYSAE
jgi:hypothetical protein